MDLSPYIESVRAGVVNASSLADEQTQHVAARLGTAIESSTRLALIHVLSDAAGTISAELAPSSVEVRMVGSEPEFVVSLQTANAEPTLLIPESERAGEDAVGAATDVEDEPVARITLRLPQSVKTRVDEMASAEGISTNAWLIRAVMDALSERSSGPTHEWPQPPRPPMPPSPNAVFGPYGPFGEHGVFSPEGPFGPGGMFRDRSKRGGREDRRSRGNVQGWVR
jgi:Arc-like DNA binding domain